MLVRTFLTLFTDYELRPLLSMLYAAGLHYRCRDCCRLIACECAEDILTAVLLQKVVYMLRSVKGVCSLELTGSTLK